MLILKNNKKKKTLTMALIALIVGIICIVLSCVYFRIINKKKYELNIPSPMSLPIIGHVHHMIGLNTEG